MPYINVRRGKGGKPMTFHKMKDCFYINYKQSRIGRKSEPKFITEFLVEIRQLKPCLKCCW